ncbi:MAG: cation:proton antiporter [Candidatus Spechtbacterales bacterium]|nr:cation:proton antiporter [Candidatus Spechtbacterales bacterium]
MPDILPFFVILLVALFFSEIFYRLHLPWVVALVLGGIVIGPHVFDVFTPDTTMNLIGEIGLIFLMFMAGLEIRLSTLKDIKLDVSKMALLNGMLPFFVGLGAGLYFDFGLLPSLLLGTIFVSSSIAVVVPSLESAGIAETRLGQTIIASTMVEDIMSLVLLSVLLQSSSPITALPLPLFYSLLFGILILMRWILPKARWFFYSLGAQKKGIFEWEFQEIFVILLGTVILFELVGLHPIIAGFFAGLVLSESLKGEALKGKLRAISYGFFIPVFFVVTGASTNIRVFAEADKALFLTIVVVGSSILVKFASGWIGARLNGFGPMEGVLVGGATIPQLSTTLAVSVSAFQLGLIREELVTAMVILSLVTTFIGPIIVRFAKSQIDKLKTEPTPTELSAAQT